MARLPLTFAAPSGSGSFEEILKTAQAAEAAGFDSLSFGDRPQAAGLEGWTLASAIAARTDRIRLFHTTLNLPYRFPQLIAKQAASLDVISRGRLDLCLGAGGPTMAADYDAYGIPLRPVNERLDDLVESIELMRGLWSEDWFSFEGKHFSLRDAVCEPKPAQGLIPIWTGAWKPRGLRIVGRLADGWIKNRGWASSEEMAQLTKTVQDAARAAGRDPDSIRCVLGGAGYVAGGPDEAKSYREQNPDGGGLVGTSEEILTTIREYRSAGVDTFLLQLRGSEAIEQMARFGSDILPEARRMPAV